jgi:hypothetical protein
MSDCVDTFSVVTRLKLERMSFAVGEAATVAAAITTIVATAPSARMDLVIFGCFPQYVAGRIDWRRLAGTYECCSAASILFVCFILEIFS